MARTPIRKELKKTRLANAYGGWMYCEGCNETIGYLCYVTYDLFALEYHCKCGNHGGVNIAFENDTALVSEQPMISLKNRLCCPVDKSPLVTILSKKLLSYECEIVCEKCNTKYLEVQSS